MFLLYSPTSTKESDGQGLRLRPSLSRVDLCSWAGGIECAKIQTIVIVIVIGIVIVMVMSIVIAIIIVIASVIIVSIIIHCTCPGCW